MSLLANAFRVHTREKLNAILGDSPVHDVQDDNKSIMET